MKILHTVEFYEPSTGGVQEVVRQLSERLAARGHTVTVATSRHPGRTESVLRGVTVQDFDVRGNAVKGLRGEVGRYVEFIRESSFDVMLNYAAQNWCTDAVFPHVQDVRAKKVLAPLGYSRLRSGRYRSYFKTLPQYLSRYDRLVYTSANYQDAAFGDAHGLGTKALVIPNGASPEEFASPAIDFRAFAGITTARMYLTVSNHYFAKGHLSVLRAFLQAGDRDGTLVIIGERPARHAWYSCHPVCATVNRIHPRVIVLGGLRREATVAAFVSADLFLFASQVECAPLVMYEAFASKTPFVTTPVGNVRDHAGVLTMVNSSSELSAVIRDYAARPDGYRALAERAHRQFLRDHTWEHIVDRYEQLYHSLA